MIDTILQEVKDCLGITDTTNDVKLTWSIRKSLATIKNMIGCDDIFLNDDSGVPIERTDKANMCQLYTSCHPIYRMCLPVKTVVSIGSSTDTNNVCTKGHYIGIVVDDCDCLCNCCSCVNIVWTGGFETLPDDLLSYVIDEANMVLCGNKTIKKYQYLDKTIEYCCDLDYKSKEKQIEMIAKKYSIPFTYIPCRCH